jgi:hypothetical protein
MSRTTVSSSVLVATLLAALVTALPAQAGPPLLCHPFNIENARSLPWNGAGGWRDGLAEYNVANLQKDTDSLLTPATPVIVRMETMRRAAIYASRDVQVASRMVTALINRAAAADRSGKADALALLDAAYFVEALRQISRLGDTPEFRERAPKLAALGAGADGYAMVKQGLALRPHDAALEFAAALIAADKSRTAYDAHLRQARAGVSTDRLLSLNISSY